MFGPSTTVSHAAIAFILLRSRLALYAAEADAPQPLSSREWAELSQRLRAADWPVDRLLGVSEPQLRADLALPDALAARIIGLLARLDQLSDEFARWEAAGIWVLTAIDHDYPARLLQRLGKNAPPVLCGVGPRSLLSERSIAVVGSRDLDDDAATFAQELGQRCAREGFVVVSGGARGADRAAMNGALEANGRVVGVLAESVERAARHSSNQQFLEDGRLVLLTPVHPRAPFATGNAMARNKLIYCLSEAAVVVAAQEGIGGTWGGASENLQHRWTPLLVRQSDPMPAGNRALLRKQAEPLPEGWLRRADDLSIDALVRRASRPLRLFERPDREYEEEARD